MRVARFIFRPMRVSTYNEMGTRIRNRNVSCQLIQQAMTMQPPQPAKAGSWKNEMTLAEREQFVACAGDLLEELGYEA